MDTRTDKQKVVDGFKLVGWILFAIAVFGLLLGGAMSSLGKLENHSRATGVIFLALALTALALTIDRSAKWIWGILSYAAVRSLGAVISGQMRVGEPMSRWIALEYCLVLAISALLASRYATRSKLTLVEKISVLVAVAIFGFGAAMESPLVLVFMPLSLSIPLLFEKRPKRRAANA